MRARLNEQFKGLFGEWLDNIRKEIDYIKMDNMTKVNEILALKNAIRENGKKLAAIESNVYAFANEVLKITHNVRDYAVQVTDIVDEIEDYNPNEDEDEEDKPVAYCDHCGRAIWDEENIVDGEEGEYCCDECREEAESEDNAPEDEVEAEA